MSESSTEERERERYDLELKIKEIGRTRALPRAQSTRESGSEMAGSIVRKTEEGGTRESVLIRPLLHQASSNGKRARVRILLTGMTESGSKSLITMRTIR